MSFSTNNARYRILKMVEKKLATVMIKKGLTLSSAESCTGGLFAHKITNISGSSKFFRGGVIAYSLEAKHKILKINEILLRKFGTVSKECAQAMAANCRKLFNSHIAIGITGVAGPESLEGKPVGLVYIAIATSKNSYVKEYKFQGTRLAIKNQAVEEGCKSLLELITEWKV